MSTPGAGISGRSSECAGPGLEAEGFVPARHSGPSSEESPLINLQQTASTGDTAQRYGPGTTTVHLISAIVFVAALSGGLVDIPVVQLVEAAECRSYYSRLRGPSYAVDESSCKLEPVQSAAAITLASIGVCESVVGFVAAIPWGYIADVSSKRLVVVLSCIGLTLYTLWIMMILYFDDIFPVTSMTLGPLFLLLGGGNAALEGVLLSMISDLVPDQKRGDAFMQIYVVNSFATSLSPGISSALIIVGGPWLTMWTGVVCMIFSTVAFMILPISQRSDIKAQFQPPTKKTQPCSVWSSLFVDPAKQSLDILRIPGLGLLLLTSLCASPLASSLFQFLVQFVSGRFSIPIYYTGYLLTGFGITQVSHGLLLMPYLDSLVSKRWQSGHGKQSTEQERELLYSRVSFGINVVGFCILGAAPTLPAFIVGMAILALGSGYSPFMRSLMSTYVDATRISVLFGMMGMADVVGAVCGQPLLAGLYVIGMKSEGHTLVGLPYFGMAVVAAVCIVVLSFGTPPNGISIDQSSQE